jgi:hypothetical protein
VAAMQRPRLSERGCLMLDEGSAVARWMGEPCRPLHSSHHCKIALSCILVTAQPQLAQTTAARVSPHAASGPCGMWGRERGVTAHGTWTAPTEPQRGPCTTVYTL